MSSFEISFLDHVAIRVKDLEVSITWYQEVLGLKKHQLKAWGKVPIFMLSGKTGIALFSAVAENLEVTPHAKSVKIDHFAFQVTQENFKKARAKYDELQLKYSVQDHHYFHSIYTNDPDGHTVELTTLVVNAEEFYT